LAGSDFVDEKNNPELLNFVKIWQFVMFENNISIDDQWSYQA